MIEIIAGPCSAESEEQVFATASALAFAGLPEGCRLSAFRAGLWKPRTRPGGFEGVGQRGLPWLKRVQRDLGLKVCVEVAATSHVEAALKSGIDIVWIGARTCTNPFDVQDIADALKGSGVPVFVKNPINPDCNLWIGAIERLLKAGVPSVTAVHRGFSIYEKDKYRNSPKWQVPVELMQRMPSVKMFCDPSHISGCPDYIPEVSQKAVDMGFDGLFIESHINPSSALSDAAQQMTPSALTEMLGHLVLKTETSSDSGYVEVIRHLRMDIDNIDDSLLDLLAQRMRLTDEIGRQKRAHNITTLQPARWENVLNRAMKGALDRGLDPEFVRDLFNLIHQSSLERQ